MGKSKHKHLEKVVRFSNRPEQVVFIDTKEYWQDISCYDIMPSMYEISTFGRVREIGKEEEIKQFGSQYNYVKLQCDGTLGRDESPFSVHRLMGYSFLMDQKRPDQNEINHIKGKGKGNHLNNLEWLSSEENEKHSQESGLMIKGEDVYGAVFTNEQVEIICQMLQDGYNYSDILNTIGIKVTKSHRDCISNIKMGLTWTHISCKYDFTNSLYRNSNFSEPQIRKMCQMLQDGKTYREIFEEFYPDIPYTKQDDHKDFFAFLTRLKTRKKLTEISKDYDF